MSRAHNDSLFRGGGGERWPRRLSIRFPLLVFVSLALMVLSRLGHPTVANLRAEIEALAAPMLAAAMVPLAPVRRLFRQIEASYDGFADLERLRAENEQLRQWEGRARSMERKVTELAALAKALEERKIDFRTARVIASSSGAFVQSALIEGGAAAGMRIGLPVINAAGVLGRIVEVGSRTSRILLLADISSRVPVFVGSAQARAVLAGDNGPRPRLMLLPQTASIAAGDEVTTSGLGGIFPRGLRIGRVVAIGPRPMVELHASLGNLEYASVLLYENPGAELAAELRQVRSTRRRANAADRE